MSDHISTADMLEIWASGGNGSEYVDGHALLTKAIKELRDLQKGGDAMLAIMLANIDSAMSCTDDKPAVFNIKPSELATWADAVQQYEAARFGGI